MKTKLVSIVTTSLIATVFSLGSALAERPLSDTDKQFKAIDGMKQLMLVMREWDQEFGGFPSDRTADVVKDSTGTDMELAEMKGEKVLNQVRHWGVSPVVLSFLRMTGGEGEWRYFPGLTSESPPVSPVLVSPAYGDRFLVLRVNGSVTKVAKGERKALLKANPGGVALAIPSDEEAAAAEAASQAEHAAMETQHADHEAAIAAAAGGKPEGLSRLMKVLGVAFQEFSQEIGSFPCDETAVTVQEITATELTVPELKGGKVLNQLTVLGYGGAVLGMPAGKGGWRYFQGVDASGDPRAPLLISPVFDGSCMLLRLDNSVTKTTAGEREALLKKHPGSISLAVPEK